MHLKEQVDVGSGLKRRSGLSAARWIAAWVVMVFAIGWISLKHDQPSASVTILPSVHPVTAMPGSVFNRMVPPTWGWLRKIRRTLFGAPVSVNVAHTILELTSEGETHLLDMLEGRPALTASNGVSAWIITRAEATELGQLRASTNNGTFRTGAVSMGPGVVATISSTVPSAIAGASVPSGLSATYAVRPRRSGVELQAAFVSWRTMPRTDADSAAIEEVCVSITNLQVTLASYVPDGMALYLNSTDGLPGKFRSTGMLIVPTVK